MGTDTLIIIGAVIVGLIVGAGIVYGVMANAKGNHPVQSGQTTGVALSKDKTPSGLSNREKVGTALELLNAGLNPFVQREMKAAYGNNWENRAYESVRNQSHQPDGDNFDTQALLSIMWDKWQEVFKKTLGYNNRSIVSELRDTRNSWAHQRSFSLDDTYRALDSVQRLLVAVSARNEVNEIERLKHETLQQRFEELTQPAKPTYLPTQADYKHALNHGIALAQSGKKSEAYQQLKGLESSHYQEVNLLLWLAFTTPYQNEAVKLVSVAQQQEPGNSSVIQARQWLSAAYPAPKRS